MALKKKLIVVGNSRALIIDKPLLEALHVEADTEFEVSLHGQSLLVKPLTKPREEILEAVRKVRKKYRKTLDRLASKGD